MDKSGPKTTDRVEELRTKIQQLLQDEAAFLYAAKTSFKHFDINGDRRLDLDETKRFFERLRLNLTIPPISEEMAARIFEKYDSKNQGLLSLKDFTNMYKSLLLRIRDKYFPPRIDLLRSSIWLAKSPLAHSKDIRKLIKFEKRLGGGAFGEVHEVTHIRNNMRCACKIIRKAKLSVPLEQVETEISILKSCDHPNVIKVFEIFEDSNSLYVLQELCHGGEVLSTNLIDSGKAVTYDENFVRNIVREIFEGLSHIHSKRIVHKDLKPENILFATDAPDSPIKIIDFGLGEIFTGNMLMTDVLRGSAIYMAPEAFKNGRMLLKSDVWSAGCIMWNLLTGEFPFDATDITEFRKVVTTQQPDFECGPIATVSHEAREFLRSVLTKDPMQRPSSAEALNHAWFETENLSRADLSKSICLNMTKYARSNNVRNIFLNLMAKQLSISNKHVMKISKLFKSLDKSKSGRLPFAVVQSSLIKAGFAEWDANLILQQLNVQGGEEVSYTAFLAACYCWRESELNLVWAAFNRLCPDGSDKVPTQALRDLLIKHASGDNIVGDLNKSTLFDDESGIDSMIRAVDRNGDGYIDWVDFEAFIFGDD